MQQYYRLVCERREEAVRRNQALRRDAAQAYTSLSAAVDTSKLETLKSQYKLSVASLYPYWLAYHHSQDHRLPSEGQRKSSQSEGSFTSDHSMSTASPTFHYYQTSSSPQSSKLLATATSNSITHLTTVHTRPITFPAASQSPPLQPTQHQTTLTPSTTSHPTPSAVCSTSPPTSGQISATVSEPSLAHLMPHSTLTEVPSQSPTTPHSTGSTTVYPLLIKSSLYSSAPRQAPRRDTATKTPSQAQSRTGKVEVSQIQSQPTDNDGVVPRPHNVLVLSVEDSESSLSLTPPPDIERENQPHNTSHAAVFSSEEQQVQPPNSKRYPYAPSDSQPIGHAVSATSGEAGLNESHPTQQPLFEREQISTTVGECSREDKGSPGKAERLREETPEAVGDAVRETGSVAADTGTPDPPTEERVEEHTPSSENSSNSFGDEGDIPLPLDTTPPTPPLVSQGTGGEVKNESERILIESGGGGVEVGGEEEGESVAGADIEGSSSSQEATEHREPHTQTHNGTDAYASFLQSVCQTTTTATPLLDSDSEGIEDMVAGRRRDPEPHSHSQFSASPPSPSTGGVAQSGEAGERLPKAQGDPGKEGDQGELLDASGSEHSLSQHRPGYTPSVIERQHTAESKTLQKRMGFWGSDDSSLNSCGIEAPTAEDDHGDFDFYM